MSWLPRGIPLSEETWRSRHGMLSGFLWLHVPVLFVIALVNGAGLAHSAVEVSPVVVLAGIARIARTRAWCEAAISFGLLTCTYVLIHITGGVTEAHFHFFIALPAVAFYQRWMPYLLALGTVVVHHFTMSAVAPELIFGHPAAISRPFVWTLIHAVFVIIAAGVMVVFWGQIEAAQVQVSELHQREAAAQRLRATYAAEQEQDLRERVARLTEDAQEASASVGTIATSVEALSERIRQVAGSAADVKDVANAAVQRTQVSTDIVTRLSETSTEITRMVDVRTS